MDRTGRSVIFAGLPSDATFTRLSCCDLEAREGEYDYAFASRGNSTQLESSHEIGHTFRVVAKHAVSVQLVQLLLEAFSQIFTDAGATAHTASAIDEDQGGQDGQIERRLRSS